MRYLVNPELVAGHSVGQPLMVRGDQIAVVEPTAVCVIWPETVANCFMEYTICNERNRFFYDME